MNTKQALTLSLILLLLPLLAISCTGLPFDIAGSTGTPIVNSFNANPSSINSGDTAILDWNVSGASSIVIDQGVGVINATGAITVTPAATTTYTLTAVGSSGSATKTVTVTVAGITESTTSTTTSTTTTTGEPPTIEFSISPAGITPRSSATLAWNVTDASSITIDNGIGSVSSSGSRTVSPNTPTNYTLTASNSYGTTTYMVHLAVAPVGSPSSSSPSPSPYYPADWMGNKITHVYHYPGCSLAQSTLPVNRKWFATTMQAQAAGYHYCTLCHPPH